MGTFLLENAACLSKCMGIIYPRSSQNVGIGDFCEGSTSFLLDIKQKAGWLVGMLAGPKTSPKTLRSLVPRPSFVICARACVVSWAAGRGVAGSAMARLRWIARWGGGGGC